MNFLYTYYTFRFDSETDIYCFIQVDPEKPVRVHGDPEKIHMEQVHKDGGLSYVENQHKTNAKLSEELNVKPMISVQ